MSNDQLEALLTIPHNPYKCKEYFQAYQYYFNNPQVKFCYCSSECKGWYNKARVKYLEEYNNNLNSNK